jgi:hypothetical protein
MPVKGSNTMTPKTLHKEWKSLAVRLIVAAASVGGLSALVGCDQSEIAQVAGDVVSGSTTLGQAAAATGLEPGKEFSQMRLASNHNETFLIG